MADNRVEGTGKNDDNQDDRVVYRIAITKAEKSVTMSKPGREDRQTATWNGEKAESEEHVDVRKQKRPPRRNTPQGINEHTTSTTIHFTA